MLHCTPCHVCVTWLWPRRLTACLAPLTTEVCNLCAICKDFFFFLRYQCSDLDWTPPTQHPPTRYIENTHAGHASTGTLSRRAHTCAKTLARIVRLPQSQTQLSSVICPVYKTQTAQTVKAFTSYSLLAAAWVSESSLWRVCGVWCWNIQLPENRETITRFAENSPKPRL